MKCGDTFLGPLAFADAHLWVVITPPDEKGEVVIVNFTTKERDDSCTISPGEHPFVKEWTVVRYQDARICRISRLERSIQKGEFRRHERVSNSLLRRIQQGALKSDFTPGKVCARIRRLLAE